MKLNVNINSGNSFKGLRQDRHCVKQLITEQKISLTENNQKNILNSIENISRHGSESGTKFLLNIAKNIKFATNIKFGFNPKNKWMSVLMMATAASAVNAGVSKRKDVETEFNEIFYQTKELSEVEQNIMDSYNNLVSKVDVIAPSLASAKNIKSNLEYFIISSETSLEDKKYILGRLEYFLSDDYKINPKLENHKFQAFSEIVNDIALDNVNSNEPNIKAQNQHQFGICTSISIARKLLAYEYKRDFVDTILSELDDTPVISVYDRKQLGKNVKINVPKLDVDFEKAIETGYRIIDISVSNWMNYSDLEQHTENMQKTYVGFDNGNFGAYRDSHVKTLSPQTGIANEHEYYQALSVCSEKINKLRSLIKEEKFKAKHSSSHDELLLAEEKSRYVNSLKSTIENLLADDYKEKSRDILIKLVGLRQKNSEVLNSQQLTAKDYLYLPNEELSVKKSKIKNLLNDGFAYAFKESLSDESLTNIYELIEVIQSIDNQKKTSQFMIGKLAFEVANAFRHQILKACAIPERLKSYQIGFEIKPEDERFLDNIEVLLKKVESGNKVVIEHLCKKNDVPPSKEAAIEFLNSCKAYIENLPALYDNLFKRMNLVDKHSVLLNELKMNKEELESNDKERIIKVMRGVGIFDLEECKKRINNAIDIMTHSKIVETFAEMFNVEKDKSVVFETLSSVISGITINDDKGLQQDIARALEVSEEEVIDILINNAAILSGNYDEHFYNLAAKEVNQFSIKQDFFPYYQALIQTFANKVEIAFVEDLLANNGEEPGIDNEKVQRIMNNLIQDINNMAITVNTIADALHIENSEGDVLNTLYPQLLVTDEFEKAGYIFKHSEMAKFEKRFDEYSKLTSEKDLYTKQEYKRKLKEIKTFSKEEKDLINMILSHINVMAKTVEHEKDLLMRDLQPKFEEVYREFGVNSGQYWVGLTPRSGASSTQQVAMLEAVTGKPYYIETNLKKGFEKIKTGKHSGISSTSVSDTSPGWHAQYVASIETVEVPSKSDPNKKVKKDILYHDNTWGKAEKENIWTDSRGYKRTDYEGEYGYKYGYVTDDKLRNGTFTTDLLTKKGVVLPSDRNTRVWDEGYSFDLMPDIILQGTTNKALNIAKSIKDTLFVDELDNIDVLTESVEKMSTEEVAHKLHVMNNIKLSFSQLFDEYIKKIKGNDVEKGISSLEEYNSLPNDNSMKLALEKAAVRATFPQASYLELLEKVETFEQLADVRAELLDDMRERFAYSFNKDVALVNYFISEKNEGSFATKIITPVLNMAEITPTNEEYKQVFVVENIISEMEEQGFDGSLGSFARIFARVITSRLIDIWGDRISVEDSNALRENIYNYVVDELLIKQDDLENKSIPKDTERLIDALFNPETDEEFVSIYNTLQGYTRAEFDRKIMGRITDEMLIDLTQKVSGYDVVQAIRAEKDDAEDALFLELYLDEFGRVFEQNVYEPFVRYNKYSNKITAQLYKEKKFDDTYLHLRYILSQLTYKKAFSKYKQDALEKYNLLPAYPHLKAFDEGDELALDSLELVRTSFKRVNFLRKQLEAFEILDFIKEFADSKNTQPLSASDIKTIHEKVMQLTKVASNDNTLKSFAQDLMPILSMKENDTLTELLPVINGAIASAEALQDLRTVRHYKSDLADAQINLKRSVETYLRLKIQPEYRSRVNAKMNDWVKALRTGVGEKEAYEEVLMLTDKYHMLKQPQKVLDEYLLNCTKDDELSKMLCQAYKKSLESLINNSKFIAVQSILMKASKNGVTNKVAQEFENVDITLYSYDENGEEKGVEVKKMSSPSVIMTMVKSLLIEDDYEIAKSFVEKFNLEEMVVPLLANSEEIVMARESLKVMQDCRDTQVLEQKILAGLRDKISALPQLDADGIVNKTYEFMDYLSKQTYNKEMNFYVDNVIASFENLISSPELDKLSKLNTRALFSDLLDSILANSMQDAIAEVKEINNYFFNANIIHGFLTSLNLDNFPELKAQVKALEDELTEIFEKQNSLMDELNSVQII